MQSRNDKIPTIDRNRGLPCNKDKIDVSRVEVIARKAATDGANLRFTMVGETLGSTLDADEGARPDDRRER